jgi:hypothetical protein
LIGSACGCLALRLVDRSATLGNPFLRSAAQLPLKFTNFVFLPFIMAQIL